MRAKRIPILLLMLTVIGYYTPVSGQDIDQRLTSLKPFLYNKWIGELKSPGGDVVSVATRTFEALPDGRVIKLTKKNEGKESWGEGFFYWDDISKRIAYFFIESNGVFLKGFVSAEENIITIEGIMTWPEQKDPNVKQSYDFKNSFEFTSDGKMIDRWYMNAFGPWRPGHVIEFNAKDQN